MTGTTRTGRTSNTGLPRSRSRSPLRERAVAPSVQRSPRARNSCRRAFLLRELRTRSWSFSFGWYRDVMQLGESTPSAMHVEGPEPRHGLTVVYRQECPDIVRHWKKYRRTRTLYGEVERLRPVLRMMTDSASCAVSVLVMRACVCPPFWESFMFHHLRIPFSLGGIRVRSRSQNYCGGQKWHLVDDPPFSFPFPYRF